MPIGDLTCRLATLDDLPALTPLIDAAIAALQAPFLTPDQIAASRAVMGVDRQLIADGTYFTIEDGSAIVGCGGWSRRATRYGGDHSSARDDRLLDPATEAANVRAMYTHPEHTRRGIGKLILRAAEGAARDEGFTRVELVATLSGEPLYRACGYQPLERFEDDRGGVPVPLVRMTKQL